jgi:hypothetical protein
MLTKKPPTKDENSPTQKPQNWQSLPGTKPELKNDKQGAQTRIVIKYDAGFGNELFIRGKGANLNWEKGILLKNTKADEWIWDSTLPFTACEFKILLNDTQYESGENHPLICGSSVQYTPKFN